MEPATWITAVIALGGVFLGGLLSGRSQDRAWRREEDHRWRDMRRAAFTKFVAAAWEYRGYATRSDIEVTAQPHPDGKRLVLFFDQEGTAQQRSMLAAYAEVQLVAENEELVHAAAMLYRTARRIAVARAVCGPVIPIEYMKPFDEADQAFANAARKELGLSKMIIDKWPANPQLGHLDDQLRQTYSDRHEPRPAK